MTKAGARSQIVDFPSTMGNLLSRISRNVLGSLRKSEADASPFRRGSARSSRAPFLNNFAFAEHHEVGHITAQARFKFDRLDY